MSQTQHETWRTSCLFRIGSVTHPDQAVFDAA